MFVRFLSVLHDTKGHKNVVVKQKKNLIKKNMREERGGS